MKKKLIILASILVFIVLLIVAYYFVNINRLETFLKEELYITEQSEINEVMDPLKSDIKGTKQKIDDYIVAENKDLPAVSANNEIVDETNPIVTINIEGYGEMQFELFPKEAPITVANFITLINSGYYDGLTCYKVEQNLMLQCGLAYNNNEYFIEGEYSSNDVENDLEVKPGSLVMYRDESKTDSNGTEFMIMTNETTSIQGEYAAFGQMISGEEVLSELNNADTIMDEPIEEIKIESITVDTKGKEYEAPEKIYI